MLKNLPVHMLWVSGELSRLARLSLASFLANGYRVKLWSYDPDHLRAEFGSNLRRVIGTARIDQNDFIGKRHGCQHIA